MNIQDDLKEFLEKDTSYFSESHLFAWFDKEYRGLSEEEVRKHIMEDHDNSCEIDQAEQELDRELTDEEEKLVIERFCESVIEDIEFVRDVAVWGIDSCGDRIIKMN